MKIPHRDYRNEQINVLLSAFNLACEELRIADSDVLRRDRVAGILMSLSSSGQHSSEMLKTNAIERFEGTR